MPTQSLKLFRVKYRRDDKVLKAPCTGIRFMYAYDVDEAVKAVVADVKMAFSVEPVIEKAEEYEF